MSGNNPGFPFGAKSGSDAFISPALSDDGRDKSGAFTGRARIKDVEEKLDAIQHLVQRLVEDKRRKSTALVKGRKRNKRENKITADAIRRATREAIMRAGQRNRSVDGIDTRSVSPRNDFSPLQDFQDFAAFVPYLPPELLQEIPWTPFVYSLRHMYMPAQVHKSLSWLISDHDARNRQFQELMHAYLHLTADRLADATPTYMDIWHSYVPSMAFGSSGSLGLLNALCALAAIHIAPLQHDPKESRERAVLHYVTALRHHHDSEILLAENLDDSVLATSLVFAHYEIWSGEIMKMGLHMLGAKKIIQQRGKEASQTPIGRALFSFFLRTDMQTSTVTGNPVFLDESWWKNDPLYHFRIPSEAPILLAADAALVKLSVIIAKLTVLKRSAIVRRKKLVAKMERKQMDPAADPQGRFQKLEETIRKEVNELQKELESWHRSLPVWFGALSSDQMSHGEHDINGVNAVEIRPQRYPHHSIAVVLICAFSANIQMWRIANPEVLIAPPVIGALVHGIFRAFLAAPTTADSMSISAIWIAALLLRNQYHREWLELQIKKRILDTDFFAWKFAYHGILHEWAILDGKQAGRFLSMPQGAEKVVPGVSRNLWHADGIMQNKLSDLSLGDDESDEYRFTGDKKWFREKDEDDDEDDFETAFTDESTTEPDSPDAGRRIPLYSSFIDDY